MSKVPDSLTSFQMLAASLIDNERISKGGWCFEIADFPFFTGLAVGIERSEKGCV